MSSLSCLFPLLLWLPLLLSNSNHQISIPVVVLMYSNVAWQVTGYATSHPTPHHPTCKVRQWYVFGQTSREVSLIIMSWQSSAILIKSSPLASSCVSLVLTVMKIMLSSRVFKEIRKSFYYVITMFNLQLAWEGECRSSQTICQSLLAL